MELDEHNDYSNESIRECLTKTPLFSPYYFSFSVQYAILFKHGHLRKTVIHSIASFFILYLSRLICTALSVTYRVQQKFPTYFFGKYLCTLREGKLVE